MRQIQDVRNPMTQLALNLQKKSKYHGKEFSMLKCPTH